MIGSDRLAVGNTNQIAIVVGGSTSVWDEVESAQTLVRETGGKCKYFVCNDMIQRFSKECVAVTLHVDKLPMWLANRSLAGFLPATDVWMCTQEKNRAGGLFATHTTDDWGGSCGLFATKIAVQEYGLVRVILCGVPMTIKGGHFLRQELWHDQLTFENRWRPHFLFLKEHARSMSGLTQEWLGSPDKAFITGGQS